MCHKPVVLLLLLVGCMYACRQPLRYPYSLHDFDHKLQPALTTIVTMGVVDYDSATSFVQKQATDEDLIRLSRSAHPVLRAVALRALLERPSIDHFDVIMHHLDDTAVVPVDWGEWGNTFWYVSDDMLQHATWKDSATRMQTVNDVLVHHSYLAAAYRVLSHIPHSAAYYQSVKAMVKRYEDRVNDLHPDFEECESALYALASYRKDEDTAMIRRVLLKNRLYLGYTSFRLMEEFPREAYLDVYESAYRRSLGMRMYEHPQFEYRYYIRSLASYKNERSARLLRSIIEENPVQESCSYLKKEVMQVVFASIGDNPCLAYQELRMNYRSAIELNPAGSGGTTANLSLPAPEPVIGPIRW